MPAYLLPGLWIRDGGPQPFQAGSFGGLLFVKSLEIAIGGGGAIRNSGKGFMILGFGFRGKRKRARRGFLFGRRRKKRARCSEGGFTTLADVPVGGDAWVVKFCERIPRARRDQLQAYGLSPGQRVRIEQHFPVTIVQIEHIEIALERSLAELIFVHD
ncbi:MAG: FeoA family protein [Anaerolineales bacterium]|jgi:Fe2+ transport system protein FeoA